MQAIKNSALNFVPLALLNVEIETFRNIYLFIFTSKTSNEQTKGLKSKPLYGNLCVIL